MRILICSHLFWPSVGGIEEASSILAEEFSALGHAVEVVTTTACDHERPVAYGVTRRPSFVRLKQLLNWCDVVLQNNVSLQTLWPALLLCVPVVVAHQTWITQPNGALGWREHAKRFSLRAVRANIAISRAIAAKLPVVHAVIPNPYRDDVFFAEEGDCERRGLIFVGRLVSDKGCDVLLDAMARLKQQGCMPSLLIVGSGPEESTLRKVVEQSGMTEQVRFAGPLMGSRLRQELIRRKVLVVPSRTPEPFGIVALEGAACGCFVIGSARGGLPDAIGPAGATFPNGDAMALTTLLSQTLASGLARTSESAELDAHLARHSRREIARRYLHVLASVARA